MALDELVFDGATRDSIPPIDNAILAPATGVRDMGRFEPVISISVNGDARAYPLRIMLWHEIVNDTVGGVPLLISYCPLCNSGVVFERRLDGRVLRFGNTGRIRRFDMVMYDHESESFWQQFTGEAIVGDLAGAKLKPVASRVESLGSFRRRFPKGRVLVPADPHFRPYGLTPYQKMDTQGTPRLFATFDLPAGIDALDYVIAIGNRAWPLARLRSAREIHDGGLVLRWQSGQNSIHDAQNIIQGRDIGMVTVTDENGRDMPHDVVFAFAFAAFRTQGQWMTGDEK